MRPAAVAAAGALLAGCGGAPAAHAPAPPRVLAVDAPSAGQPSGAHATAFALGDGRLATVAHVLGPARRVTAGGRRAPVLRVDPRLDLAVLALPGLRAPRVRTGSARAGARVGVRVLRSGAVRTLHGTVRDVITARVRVGDGPRETRPALELAVGVMPGDSGAPVLDARGRVVGMVFAQAADRDGIAYALDGRALGGV